MIFVFDFDSLSERHHAYLRILQDVMQISSTSSFSSHIGQDIKLVMFYALTATVITIITAVIIGEIYNTFEMATFSLGRYVNSINKMKVNGG